MWGTILVLNRYDYLKAGSIAFWIVYAIGGLSSTLFGAYLSKKSGNIANYRTLIIETFNVKQRIKYYVLILVLFTVYFGIPLLLGIAETKTSWYYGLLLVFQMIFFGGLEEVGWRYTFQPTLERHMPFWLASIITGFLWALWHLPLFFIDGMNKGMDFGIFLLGVLSMSFMLGAIKRVSNSLWLCVLFHAMINAFSQVSSSEGNVSDALISMCIIIVLTSAVVTLYNRSKVHIE